MELDGEVRVVLRRLGKRDAVTKTKALREAAAMAAEADADRLAQLLHVWPKLQAKLALHAEPKVRLPFPDSPRTDEVSAENRLACNMCAELGILPIHGMVTARSSESFYQEISFGVDLCSHSSGARTDGGVDGAAGRLSRAPTGA